MTAPYTRRQGPWISPVVPVIVSAFFVLTRLGQEGLGNEYNAAAVRSMLQSGQNLFYAAFDPAGFLAVDKPPVGLWLQTSCAAVFGFYGRSLILPQGALPIASAAVLRHLVERASDAWRRFSLRSCSRGSRSAWPRAVTARWNASWSTSARWRPGPRAVRPTLAVSAGCSAPQRSSGSGSTSRWRRRSLCSRRAGRFALLVLPAAEA